MRSSGIAVGLGLASASVGAVHALFERYASDRRAFFEEECPILTVPGGQAVGRLQAWHLWDEQLRLLDAYERQLARRGYVRILLPKCRKRGMSTEVQALGIHHCLFSEYADFRTYAHEEEATGYLYEIGSRFLASMDPDVRAVLPQVVSDYRQEMEWDNGSKRSCRTAGGSRRRGGKGRGATLTFLHGSEMPQWDAGAISSSAADVAQGLINAVPDQAGVIILEATCLGPHGLFYDQCVAAQAGKNEYELLFLDAKCYVRVDQDVRRRDEREGLDHEMKRAAKAGDRTAVVHCGRQLGYSDIQIQRAVDLDLSPGNVAFWQAKLNGPECNGDQERFDHEYPYTLDLAFSGMGEQVFPMALVRQRIDEIRAGEVTWREGAFVAHEGKVIFEEGPGPVRLFAEPRPGWSYLMGGDLASGQRTPKHDYTALSVLGRVGKEQVCGLYGQIPPEEAAEQAALMSRYYNEALVAPEREDYGLAFLQELRRQWPDTPLYYQTMPADVSQAQRAHYVGWASNSRTRKLVAATFKGLLRTGRIVLNDLRLLEEMLTFIEVGADRRPDHAEGKHSDFIFAHGIALVIDRELEEEGEPAAGSAPEDIRHNIDNELRELADDEDVEPYEVWF